MRFANPAGLLLALLALPVIALHVLRPRRPARVVSSTFLWERIEHPVTSATPLRRLRPSWLLLLQLLTVGLFTAAAANPVRVQDAPLAPHTVFLIDASGSMLALDGTPDRIADARARALELRDQLPTGGIASVIEVGATPRVLLSSSGDEDAFARAVAATRATAGHADFPAAFALAEGLETADAPIGFVLVSDGGLTDEEERLLPLGSTYEQVGSAATNRAIVDLDVEPTDAGLHVRVTVANVGGPAATQTLRIDVDGRTRARVELDLGAGSTVVHEADVAQGDRVDAYLEGEDLLAADNLRSAIARRRQALRVEVIGPEPDPFLLAVLSSIDGVELVGPGTPDDRPAATDGGEVPDAGADADQPDLVVYDRARVPADPRVPFLAIAPPGGSPGVTASGVVDLPAVTLVRTDDPLLTGLDLSGLGISTTQRIASDTAEVLIGAEGAPLLLRGRTDGVRFAYLPFAVGDSNLPLQVAFPLLVDRLVADLTGASLPPTAVEVGDTLTVPTRSGGVIVDPAGTVTELPPGSLGVVAERPGLWTIAVPERPELSVAVNPAAAESTLTPVPSLQTPARVTRPGDERPASETSLRPWIIGALLAALVVEFLMARRSVGVRPRQWRIATALRVLAAISLIGALFQVGFDRRAGSVATVFVVDASDSMGPTGRATALTFVREALDQQPGGARAGVVLFGDDARIEALLQSRLSLGQTTAKVDPTHSDLSAALRLGGAILPDDARRRIVLISDGRATEGDAEREAAQLQDQGIEVDVVTIDNPGGADVAVAAITAPERVAEGELVPVRVRLQSTTTGPAVVTLRRDGQTVATQEVDLDAGSTSLTFQDVADGGGPLRYQVEVETANDGVPQNDLAFAAVAVEGSPSVLVVEGATGEGVELTAALSAGGLAVDRVDTAGLPGLDELVGYSSILLVDVAEGQLTARQVAALSGAVRDAGRGLVTIGGDRAYGLGGYYTSDLEQLLPVISEILDPKRRQSVAEVLAIDTSGSMGACHCAEGQFASNRIDGGVNKTDISRAAAARTIDALSAQDEVGVLAFDVEQNWVIDLQQLPSQDVVNAGLATLNPDGGTNPSESLATAAAALRESNAALKHVILFTDGFTSQAILADLAEEAATLAAEGITVSVVATGEGAAAELEQVAVAGQGRFYPGRDLQRIPEIIMEEAVLASRDFVVEGRFLPTVTSALPVVSGLTESPPLLGYVATTARGEATTLLRIGDDEDPLLATWQIGLGRATSWTSDASARWSRLWTGWDGYVEFWGRLVRDTFPATSEGTTAVVDDGTLRVTVEGDGSFGDDATAVARITDPTLGSRELQLDRVGPDRFVGEVPVDDAGVYVVGTAVELTDGSTIGGSALTSQSYAREYEPGVADRAALARIAQVSGGRAEIDAAMAFDRADLAGGQARVDLARWLFPLAMVLFVLAVILSRLTLSPALAASAAAARAGVARRRRSVRRPQRAARDGGVVPAAARAEELPDAPDPRPPSDEQILADIARDDERAETETLDALLRRARRHRGVDE